LNEGIDKDDCWYDVRAMGNQPLCPKKRKFFKVANHADVMLQLRYQSDLERAKPRGDKPPFACMRLCNPSIQSLDERGFIAATPGKDLQKCIPRQIEVERKASGTKQVLEAQILLNAANDQRTIGQQWKEYHDAKEEMDQDQLGLGNGDLTAGMRILKGEYDQCSNWLPANKIKLGVVDNTYDFEEHDREAYIPKDDGTFDPKILTGVTGTLKFNSGAAFRSLGASMASVELPAKVGETLQVRTKIENDLSLTFTTKIGETIEYADGTVTMLDQTWTDDSDDIHGVATIMVPSDDKKSLNCFKVCVGDYEPGNLKCNDGKNRSLDCIKKT